MTNLVTVPVEMLTQHQQGMSGSNTVIIVTIVLAAFAQVISNIAGYIKSKSAETTAKATADTVKEIHVSVNSERTAVLKKVDDMTAEILRLSGENKTLIEQKHGAEVAAAAKATEVVVTNPEPIKVQTVK